MFGNVPHSNYALILCVLRVVSSTFLHEDTTWTATCGQKFNESERQ